MSTIQLGSCTDCKVRWAQQSIGLGEKLCRRCFNARFGYLTVCEREAIINSRKQRTVPVRVIYEPPIRPTRTYRDPRTGELIEFEIVFDGR